MSPTIEVSSTNSYFLHLICSKVCKKFGQMMIMQCNVRCRIPASDSLAL